MTTPRARRNRLAPRDPRARAARLSGTTRERLVGAARLLLEEGGYAAASVQAIADRAGVSAGALYRHFPSKAELFVDVFREAAKRDLAAIDEAAATGRCVSVSRQPSPHARRAFVVGDWLGTALRAGGPAGGRGTSGLSAKVLPAHGVS